MKKKLFIVVFALLSSLAARNSHIAHDLWIFEKPKGQVLSAGLICGGFRQHPKGFPGIFFEENTTGSSKDKHRLPGYVYDLSQIAGRDNELKVALITGEDDFLRHDNNVIKEEFNNPLFYDAKNEGELHMHHVFPIAHPEWPQSVKAIQLISDNATRKL